MQVLYPVAGGLGNTTHILRAIIEHGITEAAGVTITDAITERLLLRKLLAILLLFLPL